MPIPEAAKRFGLLYETVRKRASRERWLTDKVLKDALSQRTPDVPAEQAISESFQETGQDFRSNLLRMSKLALSRVSQSPPDIVTWQDAKIVADIGMKAAGLDTQAGPTVQILLASDPASMVVDAPSRDVTR